MSNTDENDPAPRQQPTRAVPDAGTGQEPGQATGRAPAQNPAQDSTGATDSTAGEADPTQPPALSEDAGSGPDDSGLSDSAGDSGMDDSAGVASIPQQPASTAGDPAQAAEAAPEIVAGTSDAPVADDAAQAGAGAHSDAASDPPADRTVITAPAGQPAGPEPAAATIVSDITPAAPVPAAQLVEPGTLINNNYRIESLISAGGMGEVYRAVNVFTGDPVAVKVILPDLARDHAMIDLFRREARVLVQLRDDAIVSYHNFVLDQATGRYCLIMEFVEGTHLGTRTRDRQPMPDDEAALLMRRLARGLGQAHMRGVTHRDLSPDNVILRHDRIDEAVLIDFGIARSTELGDGLEGRFAGKFKYIAPEQLGHHDGQIGPWTDIYGLALLITAMLRGRPLDMGNSVVTASDARQAIPDLSGLSHRMFPLLQHMLEPDPAARPGDMAGIIAMLDDPMRIPARYRLPLWADAQGEAAVSAGVQTTGVSETPFGVPAAPPASSPATAAQTVPDPGGNMGLIVAGAVVALGLLAGGLWWFMLRDDMQSPPETPDPPPLGPTLPPRDSASRDGFLADYDLGPCTLAQRVTSGPDTGTIEVFGATRPDSAALSRAYGAAFGTSPAVNDRHVTEAQCPALDLTRMLGGRAAPPPALTIAAEAAGHGFRMEAAADGLDGRNLWLALIEPGGAVYDLTAQSQARPGGGVMVGASVDRAGPAADGAAPYLLLAVTSSAPLVALAAAPAGTAADVILPRVLDELHADGEAAAASLALVPIRQPAPVPDPETGAEPGDQTPPQVTDPG
ncbi:MAG: protein kinase [Paracoccus sp. (in: a-proteobacteria)]|nr:protein kinase [Paracoccus sp. (in: a-proteobacteria)]